MIVSALKKSDFDSSLLLRFYEIEGAPVETGVRFLGATPAFGETNLLEEEVRGQPRAAIKAGPYAIRTLKLRLNRTNK